MYIMSKTRSMYAGSSGSNYGVNKNSPGNGNGKWQGLPPITNMRSLMIPYVKTRARGDNRDVVFCMNQLGGIGKISNMFATTADGVKEPCSGFGNNNNIINRGPYPIKSGDTLTVGYKSNSELEHHNTELLSNDALSSLANPGRFIIPLKIPLQCLATGETTAELTSLQKVEQMFFQIPRFSFYTNNTIEETRKYLSRSGMILLDNVKNLNIANDDGSTLYGDLVQYVISPREMYISRINKDGSIPKSQSPDFSDVVFVKDENGEDALNPNIIVIMPAISVNGYINSNIDKLYINDKEVTNNAWFITSVTPITPIPEVVEKAFASASDKPELTHRGGDDRCATEL